MGRISSFETLEQRRLFAVAVDLRVTNVIVPPGMIGYSGEFGSNTDLSLEFDLQNVGTTVYSGSPHTLVSFSSDPSFDLDDPDADADVDGSVTLAPGETKRFRGDFFADSGMAAGNYFIEVRVLPDSGISGLSGELNLADNFFALTGAPSLQIVTKSVPGAFISGTAERDLIELRAGHPGGGTLFATVNGLTQRVPREWERVFVDAGKGNDVIVVAPTDQGHLRYDTDIEGDRAPIFITGSSGNDSIVGGLGDEELSGGTGSDRILGGGGNDFLIGGAQHDYLNGEAGNDRMSGGGGNDRLMDVVGRDHFLGGAGNDLFVSRDTRSDIYNNPDTLSGGPGYDRAQVDVSPSADNLASIDELLA